MTNAEHKFLIRVGNESDRPFLRTLYLRSRKVNWDWVAEPEWQLEDFDAATLGETVWVAVSEGHRAGFASVLENNNFLHNLFVEPGWQGYGAGSALLRHVQSNFTHTGSLKCLIQNQPALAFYQQHGWRNEARGFSPDGEYWLMHYRLP